MAYRWIEMDKVLRRLLDSACIPCDQGNADYQKYLEWVALGNIPEPVDPPRALTVADYSAAVQAHLDARAQALGYDNIFTAATYADEPAVPEFQEEGRALRAWRSRVWAVAAQVLADVTAGSRPAPSIEQLLAELPAAPF